jgi:hypothetical protein
MTHVRDASFGYMDDVHVLGSHLSDIHLAFEAAAGAILNRIRMSLILGLGSWEGRQDWPLPWLLTASSLKVLGFDNCPTLTVFSSTWTRFRAGLQSNVRN